MKFSVDVKCTPQELRTFLGLPDVEPMQQAVMDEMQRRMVTSMDQLSPTAVMKDWFAPMTAMQQAFTNAFTGASNAATSRGDASVAGRAGERRAGHPAPGADDAGAGDPT
ncbi:MAG: DUF6489 family protein [Micrococcales bacterium]|nr:DUF6489 family protein [Micrococcales bacterium]